MNLEIRYNGQLDRKRMITNRVKAKAINLGNKIDYAFVNGHWPKQNTAQ